MSIKDLQINLRAKSLYSGPIDGVLSADVYQGLAEFITYGKAPDNIGPIMARWLPVGKIDSRNEIIAFLAHASHESNLRPVAESLDYSVEALISKFSRERISIAEAQKFGRTTSRRADQVAIANTIYGGAWGKKNLGNLIYGDGWPHRGMGLMQNTGRWAQGESGKKVGLDLEGNPQLLLTLEGAVAGAVGFWMLKDLNAVIARPEDTSVLETKLINGGDNGLAERILNKTRLRAIWPA